MAPAAEHNFNETPLPTALVLDADFVVNVLHEREEFHKECARFAGALLDGDVTIVYTQLLRLEFLSGWQNAVRRRGIPAGLLPAQARLMPDAQADLGVLYGVADRILADFLSLFDQYEVRLSAKLQDGARAHMARYNLKPLDACLIAAAFQVDVPHVASLDGRFRRVGGIHLWNHHIPERRQTRRRG
ncbi:MAG: type II toxin-antitoxin system VapC family toxin [Chloroflexi bacterium]|nr:type II toxin-antitoxin system VapC family toxin [Chloroflexota bacterium]